MLVPAQVTPTNNLVGGEDLFIITTPTIKAACEGRLGISQIVNTHSAQLQVCLG